MINNRQGGRRRGRGGGGGRAPNMNPGAGNRQDNRQRGNAAQLLEKYKGLARDAQMQGDRVQTEYFLQFADHYYRVLGESRARYEEQRRQRGDYDSDDGEDETDGEEAAAEQTSRDSESDESPRHAQRNGEARPRRGRSRRDFEGNGEADEGERIAVDSLPPSIASSKAGDGDDDAEERAPRRRTRRPRGNAEEAAPAA